MYGERDERCEGGSGNPEFLQILRFEVSQTRITQGVKPANLAAERGIARLVIIAKKEKLDGELTASVLKHRSLTTTATFHVVKE